MNDWIQGQQWLTKAEVWNDQNKLLFTTQMCRGLSFHTKCFNNCLFIQQRLQHFTTRPVSFPWPPRPTTVTTKCTNEEPSETFLFHFLIAHELELCDPRQWPSGCLLTLLVNRYSGEQARRLKEPVRGWTLSLNSARGFPQRSEPRPSGCILTQLVNRYSDEWHSNLESSRGWYSHKLMT